MFPSLCWPHCIIYFFASPQNNFISYSIQCSCQYVFINQLNTNKRQHKIIITSGKYVVFLRGGVLVRNMVNEMDTAPVFDSKSVEINYNFSNKTK